MRRDAELTVLVTGGGTATALSVVKGLRLDVELAARVVIADCAERIAGRYLADEAVTIPRADDPRFVDGLLAATARTGAQVVFPLFDDELPLLARARERFEAAGVALIVASPACVDVCRDKARTMELLSAIEVAHPETFTPEAALTLDTSAYPLFVKPRMGRGSVGVARVTEEAELRRALRGVASPMVQRCIEGDDVAEVTVDTLSDRQGRFVAACPRIRQVVKAGQSYQGVTRSMPEVVAACRRICEELPLTGPACIQCFVTPRGPCFFEVNPRFGAATILSIHAGLNGPAWLVREALGMPRELPEIRWGLQMLRFWQEVIIGEDGTATSVPPLFAERTPNQPAAT